MNTARRRDARMASSFLLALSLFGAPTWAATFSPTRVDDPAPDGCLPNDCSLREAILAANEAVNPDLIVLADLVYELGLNGTDTDDNGDLDIRSDLAIRGPATIDAQGLGRIFDIHDDAEVTFDQLVLQDANTSLASNGSLSGGAVQINGGRLTVRSGVFRDNATQSQGGGIYTRNGAVLIVEDTVFVDNDADNGAGIFANGDVTVRNTRFERNDAELRGAAMYVAGTQSDVVLERVSLIDNASDGSGGGAILFLGRDLQVNNLLATGNTALDGNGGVLATTGTGHGKSVRITQAIFADNAADDGGALSLADDEDPVELAHVAFVDNRSERQGGAIYTTGGLIDIANVTFSGNVAGTDGGAIHLFGEELTLRQVTITGGAANRGSAISVGGSSAISSASMVNSIIDGNCRLQNTGTFTSLGGNVESQGNSCGLNQASDQAGVSAQDLGLLPLRQTSGATPSHPLARVSAARGVGVPATCAALPTDQLFRPRAAACSAGAVDGAFLLADGFEANPTLGSMR